MPELNVLNVVTGIVVLVGFILFLSSFFTIHTKQAGIVERLGKFERIAGPGLNLRVPMLESLVYVEDLNMQLMDVPVQSKTKDDATVHIPVRVQYYVLPDKVQEAYYMLDDPEDQIKAHVENVILSYIPSITLDETYQQEEQIAARVAGKLKLVMEKFGYAIENALVTQIIPSDAVVNAMNDINAARREQVAAVSRAEAQKITKIANAEADKQTKILAGEGVAGERSAIIEGLRKSVEDLEAGAKVNAQEAMVLIMMAQYFDALRDIGKNSNTILMPHSPSAVQDLYGQLRTAITTGTLAATNAAEEHTT